MPNLTKEQQLSRCNVSIMRSPQFALISGVLMCGKTTWDETVPTACTDGWNVKIGPDYWASLNEKEQCFLLVHEAMHKALRQLTVWHGLFKQDPMRANQAADYVINQMIVDMDPKQAIVKFKDSWLLDPKYRGMDTKQVFDALGKNPKPEGGEGSGKGEKGDGKPEQGQGNVPSAGPDEHEWGVDHELTPEEKEARERAIDNALRQGQILAGKLGGKATRAMGELLAPKVDWREQLRDFVTSATSGRDASTWRKPNRRWLAQGAYMPSAYSERIGHVVVAIDTSGSIGLTELSEFMAEVVAVCETVQPEVIDLLWWDTRVAGHQTFREGEYATLTAQAKPKGGGGTNFACVPAYLAAERLHPDCLIVLTDGYVSSWGVAPHCPTLFAITGCGSAPYGVSIKL